MHAPAAVTLRDLVTALDALCPSIIAHGRRVATYATRLAAQYGLGAADLQAIRVGALLHDIGKIEIPPSILAKPGKLTEREWRRMKTHPERGCDLVERLGFEDTVCEIVLYHHERFDGNGYPHRLKDRAIGWTVRLVSVVDAFDALTSDRVYRSASSIDAARTQLAREAGRRFCPWITSGLLALPRALLVADPSDSSHLFVADGCPDQQATRATEAWTPSI